MNAERKEYFTADAKGGRWTRVLCIGAVLAGLSACSPEGELGSNDISGNPSTIVALSDGKQVKIYQDDASGDVWHGRGIPYAASPIRFRSPTEPTWSGTFDAADWGNYCVQSDKPFTLPDSYGMHMDEDCLQLNLWTPSTEGSRPVLVWIHGGGWSIGTGAGPGAHGGWLANNKDIVVVSLNYRLGAMGFLAHDALVGEDPANSEIIGNYGFLDQVKALEWVRDEIASFGGDPNRVTIMGQSAGAASVQMLMVSPLSAGLFHRAVMLSGPSLSDTLLYEQAEAGEVAEKLSNDVFELNPAAYANCAHGRTPAEQLDCLRHDVSAADLAKVQPSLADLFVSQWTMAPIIDGYSFTDAPETLFEATPHPAANVPMIVGNVSDEGKLITFNLRDANTLDQRERILQEKMGAVAGADAVDFFLNGNYEWWNGGDGFGWAQVVTELFFNCHLRRTTTEREHGDGEDVWVFLGDYVRGVEGWLSGGQLHGTEIVYWFHNAETEDPAEIAMMDELAGYLASFVKHGDPNDAGLPTWEKYDHDGSQRYLTINDELGHDRTDVRSERMGWYDWHRESNGSRVDGLDTDGVCDYYDAYIRPNAVRADPQFP